MANDKLQVQIDAVDKATETLKKVQRELENLQDKTEKASKKTENAVSSNASLTKSFITANLATTAIVRTFGFLKSQFEQSVEVANRYERTLTGLSVVSEAFGIAQQDAQRAAQQFSADGLVPLTNSAEGFKNLMASGFSLQQTIHLMDTFKNAAVYNRQGTLSMGEAVERTTQGIKFLNSQLTDSSGLGKNLDVVFKQHGMNMANVGDLTQNAAARQAIYNDFMAQGAKFMGNSELASQSAEAAQARFNMQIEQAQMLFGQALTPAVQFAIQGFSQFAQGMDGEASPALQNLAKGLVWFVGGVKVFANAIIQYGALVVDTFKNIWSAAQKVLSGDFKGAFNDAFIKQFDSIKQRFLNVMEDVDQTRQGIDAFSAKIDQGLGKLPNIMKGAAPKMVEPITKAGKEVADKLKKVGEDMGKEMENYARTSADKIRSFNENMRDLVIKHRDAITDLRSQMEGLTNDFNEASKERADAHGEKRSEIAQKYEDETKTLKDNLARRLTDSKGSDEQITAYFQAQIAEKERLRNEELAKEDARYSAEEAKQKAAHTKQLTALQTKLNAELEIERKHRAEFEQFKNAVEEDDITRLKNSFEREMAELKRQHDERMTELRKQQEEILAMRAAAEVKAAKSIEKSAQSRKVETKTTTTTTRASTNQNFTPRVQASFEPNLKKYHEGGVVPGTGEVPILAKGGETVLTQQQSQGLLDLLKGIKSGVQSSVPNMQMTNHIYNQVDLVGAMREMGWRARIR